MKQQIKFIGILCLCASLFSSVTLFAAEEKPSESSADHSAATSERYPELQKEVAAYMSAWVKGNYDEMYPFENWKTGEKLEKTPYIQTFDANFGLESWKITKIERQPEDEYLVLIVITHNPPKQIMAYLPKDKKIQSTLRQYWGQEGDKYSHLFYIEKERLMNPMKLLNPPPKPDEATQEHSSEQEKH